MVGQQTNEIGIRMAFGADRVRVIGLVLFFGIPTADTASFAGAVAVVLIVAGLASYLPARKVVAANPMLGLQCR